MTRAVSLCDKRADMMSATLKYDHDQSGAHHSLL